MAAISGTPRRGGPGLRPAEAPVVEDARPGADAGVPAPDPGDVDANPGLSQAFNIMSIPTIAFFKPGEQPKGVTGFRRFEEFEQTFGFRALATIES